jgi:hypothetical protein
MSDGAMKVPPFGGMPGQPVPQVNPEDLKILWRTQQEFQARHPGLQAASGRDLAQRICTEGADTDAVGYRMTLLWLLSQIASERFAGFLKDGQPTDAAFRAAAKVPAKWMGEGVSHQAPFDVDEFLRLCDES